MIPWSRTFSVTKYVGRKYIKLSIPFPTLDVKELKVQDWNFSHAGNTLVIRLRRDPPHFPPETPEIYQPPEFQEKLENYQRFSVYPGERAN